MWIMSVTISHIRLKLRKKYLFLNNDKLLHVNKNHIFIAGGDCFPKQNKKSLLRKVALLYIL